MKKTVIQLLVLVVLVVVVVVLVFPTMPEDVYWRWAMYRNKSQEYARYLKWWPEGRHVSEANARYDASSFILKGLIDRSVATRCEDCEVQIGQNPDGRYNLNGNMYVSYQADGYKSNIWVDGTKHIYRGRIELEDHVFDSNLKSPLVFQVEATRGGLIYLKGKGTVTLPDGKQVKLPQKR